MLCEFELFSNIYIIRKKRSEKLLQQVAIKKLKWHHNYCLLLTIVYCLLLTIVYVPTLNKVACSLLCSWMSVNKATCSTHYNTKQ